MNTKHVSTLSKLLRRIRGMRLYVALSLLFAALSVALTLLVPVLTGRAVDKIIGPGNVDFPAVLRICGLTAALVVAHSRWPSG